MTCTSCGTQNDPGRKFCLECGAPLAAVCGACGATNPPAAKFCGECGGRLGLPRPARPRAASPRRIRPRRRLPARPRRPPSPSAASSRSSSPTSSGFTTLAEDRDAEEVRELLSRYFDLARGIVERYGGTVEKFIGDAVMAVWGTPTSHEDDAERAVRAALELVDAVRGLGPSVQARAGRPDRRGGRHDRRRRRGHGRRRPGQHRQPAPVRRPAGRRARRRGDDARGLAAPSSSSRPASSCSRARPRPVPAWRALRVVAERGGRGRSDALEAPFVGRDDELRLLKDLFHATARERRVRLVSVIGPGRHRQEPPRVGVPQVHRRPRRDGLLAPGPLPVVRQRDHVLGARARWSASGRGLAETDDEATTRERIAETAARWVPDEQRAPLDRGGAPGPPRRRRAGARRPGAALRGLADVLRADRRRRTRSSWSSRTSSGPTAGLLDFIDHLLEWSRGVPIYVVTLARPELLETRPDWGAGKRNFTSLAPRAARAGRRCASCWPASCPGLPGRRGRARSSPAPTASRSTPSRSCGCSSPRDALEAAERRLPAGRRPRRPRRPGDPPRAHRGAPRRARPRGPRPPPGGRGARPDLHRRRPGGGRRRATRPTSSAAWSRSCAASCSSATRTRGRPSAASSRSSSRSSARSPTRRSPVATARRATSPRRATSRRSSTRSWRARSPRTTSRPTATPPKAPRRTRSAVQARIALRAAGERAVALGAQEQALGLLPGRARGRRPSRRSGRPSWSGPAWPRRPRGSTRRRSSCWPSRSTSCGPPATGAARPGSRGPRRRHVRALSPRRRARPRRAGGRGVRRSRRRSGARHAARSARPLPDAAPGRLPGGDRQRRPDARDRRAPGPRGDRGRHPRHPGRRLDQHGGAPTRGSAASRRASASPNTTACWRPRSGPGSTSAAR